MKTIIFINGSFNITFMNLVKISLSDLKDEEVMKKALQEAYNFGLHRGKGKASGDKYAMLGGPSVEWAIRDYAKIKFGLNLEDVPRELIKA